MLPHTSLRVPRRKSRPGSDSECHLRDRANPRRESVPPRPAIFSTRSKQGRKKTRKTRSPFPRAARSLRVRRALNALTFHFPVFRFHDPKHSGEKKSSSGSSGRFPRTARFKKAQRSSRCAVLSSRVIRVQARWDDYADSSLTGRATVRGVRLTRVCTLPSFLQRRVSRFDGGLGSARRVVERKAARVRTVWKK